MTAGRATGRSDLTLQSMQSAVSAVMLVVKLAALKSTEMADKLAVRLAAALAIE